MGGGGGGFPHSKNFNGGETNLGDESICFPLTHSKYVTLSRHVSFSPGYRVNHGYTVT